MTIRDYLDKVSDKDLIEMCKECEDWKKSGVLLNGKFKDFCSDVEAMCYDTRQLEDYIYDEALRRFKGIVPILLKRYPNEFIK